MFFMVRTLEKAIEEVANLPDADQEQIGRRLPSHVEKLRQLRTEIDKGVRSLDGGEGKPLEIEEFLRQQNERYGRRRPPIICWSKPELGSARAPISRRKPACHLLP